MSTTVTMLETYDAQMLDYQNDTDVAMHPSSDSWLNEATMDDDTFTNDATIEVDMDGLQEDQTTEYEMTDEVESYAPEMVDIEVEDAQPPQPAPLHDSSKPNAATPTTPHPADISIPSDSAPPHSAATLPPSSQYPVDSQLNEPYTPTDIQVEESVPSIPLRSTPPQTTQSPQDAHSGHTWALDLSRPAEEPIPVLPISLSSSFQTGEYAGSVDGGAYAEVPVSADVLELQHEEGDHEPHTMPEEEHVPTNEPSGHPFVQPAHVEEEYAAEATCQQLQQTENAEVAEQQQPETAADETCAPVESNDPHEISEGVYIDPPPPVLISLRSSEYPNICLFNRPSSRSGTPYSPTAESPGSDSLVLLHHQPVLYYEPLSSVFDALRREEYLMNSPDLRDGELILDAYDLQLAVSEDNVYAREVTLHDLNVIHDGSDIAGPLRLRLRSSVPRFAFRYHQLRDQITRLHLATELAEAGENVEHQPVEGKIPMSRLPQRLNNPKPMPCPSRVYHRTHRQTHPKMTVWKRIKTKQPRSHSYLRKRSGMTIMAGHKLIPTTPKKANMKVPTPMTHYPKKMHTRLTAPANLLLHQTSPTSMKKQKLARNQLSPKSQTTTRRMMERMKTSNRIIQTSLTTTTVTMAPKLRHTKSSTSRYYQRYLTHLTRLENHPLKAVWAKIPMKHQQRNQFNKITLPLHMSMKNPLYQQS
ncbi:hypothetical protein BDN71DRAFT_1223093 [Pleurotus eryngii]|uniref:Uncharacterized protein n=1 Tax=Pleurotus eryngii TaxID=5323 RepID=A0A9P5ZV04_PLEER|nr:hypothetical protein BDN71DRAFT_1223093 [Pleurotus eryngii]